MEQAVKADPADWPLIRKVSRLIELEDSEISHLATLMADRVICPAQTEIVTAGEDFRYTSIVQEGWAAHFKLLPDGRQQILNFSLPGDIIGLYAAVWDKAEHSVKTITDCVVSRIDPGVILSLFSEYPRLAAVMCWSSETQGAILREQVVRIGRRTAYERTAHLFIELLRRLEAVGLAEDNRIAFPLTQELLADALGLTAVHINRTIRKLRNNGLIEYSKGNLAILQRNRLRQVADFDPAYLEPNALPPESGSHVNP